MSEENTNPPNEETSTIETLRMDLEKARKDHLYLLAEFDNYRKNALKERSDLLKYGSERFVRDLLNVLDNFERALETELTPERIPVFRDGINMISEELKALLTKHGVQALGGEGQPFDPSVQEALSSEPTDKVPPGNVSRVFKKAYKLHDRLLRPAQVVVAVEPSEKS